MASVRRFLAEPRHVTSLVPRETKTHAASVGLSARRSTPTSCCSRARRRRSVAHAQFRSRLNGLRWPRQVRASRRQRRHDVGAVPFHPLDQPSNVRVAECAKFGQRGFIGAQQQEQGFNLQPLHGSVKSPTLQEIKPVPFAKCAASPSSTLVIAPGRSKLGLSRKSRTAICTTAESPRVANLKLRPSCAGRGIGE